MKMQRVMVPLPPRMKARRAAQAGHDGQRLHSGIAGAGTDSGAETSIREASMYLILRTG